MANNSSVSSSSSSLKRASVSSKTGRNITFFQHLLGLGLLLLLVWYLYQPSLSGGMVFDDEENFKALQDVGKVDDNESFLKYLLINESGALRRPVSMASFLLDAREWPVDTYRIKRTNVLIHIINTALIFCLVIKVIRQILPACTSAHARVAALMVALLWAVNPFQVSTVAYMIQRMTQLSALFVLLGLIVFISGEYRYRSDSKRPVRCLMMLTAGFGTCLVLGLFSKENALLLCAFVLLLNGFLARQSILEGMRGVLWRGWLVVTLWLPLLLFVVYCLYTYHFFTQGFGLREFDAIERILTESRILWRYIKLIFMPDISQMGLYVGSTIEISRSLIQPVTTLTSILGLGIALFICFRFRKRYPLISFGIFFFFCGHLMESTLIPLELYFEHRNYLPQLGLWIAVAGVGLELYTNNQIKEWKKKIFLTLCLIVCATYGALTYVLTSLWGDSVALAKYWYEQFPSVRATETYAIQLDRVNDRAGARAIVLESVTTYNPNSISLNIALDYFNCLTQEPDFKFDPTRYEKIYGKTEPSTGWVYTIQQMYSVFGGEGECPGVTRESLTQLIEAAINHPDMEINGRVVWHAYWFLSTLAFEERRLDKTIGYLDKACEKVCNPSIRAKQAYLLLTAGLIEKSEEYFQKAKQLMTPLEARRHPGVKEVLVKLEEMIIEAKKNPVPH